MHMQLNTSHVLSSSTYNVNTVGSLVIIVNVDCLYNVQQQNKSIE